jgi:hypothetical protein
MHTKKICVRSASYKINNYVYYFIIEKNEKFNLTLIN